MKLKKYFLGAIVLIVHISNCFGYGALGHSTIGAVADRLIQGNPAAAKINSLIDGMRLEEVAVIPDKIKIWDNGGPSNGKFKVDGHPSIESQLEAYWQANSAHVNGGEAEHRQSHFTDIPVKSIETYAAGHVGRSDVDLVQTMKLCVRVLEGKESEDNPRKITKPIAVILLAHFVGDIHQPLHVGAEYFAADGTFADPDKGEEATPDEGGNTFDIDFQGVNSGSGRYKKNLHSFWDDDAVTKALDDVKAQGSNSPHAAQEEDAAADFLANHEPSWKLDSSLNVEDWPEAWADEIQPIAKEAYDRLDYESLKVSRNLEYGTVKEKENGGQTSYLDWAGTTVENELNKAGWRLAAILEKSVGG